MDILENIKINTRKYRVKDISQRHYKILKRGIIDKILKKELIEDEFIYYNEFKITAKWVYEDFSRIFIFTEREFKDLKNYE